MRNKKFTEEQLNLRMAWRSQRTHARCRVDKNGNPIQFNFTFSDWLQVWVDSGKLHERGRHHGQYVMTRINDEGNYEIGNVEIKTQADNLAEGNGANTLGSINRRSETIRKTKSKNKIA